jgi:transcriptional regulator with XRE-family HTH domain
VEQVTDGPIEEPDLAALRLHLARLRKARGWSYDELAARAGVGRATLTALESGKPHPSRGSTKPATSGTLVTWYRLARALEVDLGDLLRPLYGNGSPDVSP